MLINASYSLVAACFLLCIQTCFSHPLRLACPRFVWCNEKGFVLQRWPVNIMTRLSTGRVRVEMNCNCHNLLNQRDQGTRPETGFGSMQGTKWMQLTIEQATAERVRGLFLFLPAPRPAAWTPLPPLYPLVSPCSPFSPPSRLWSCFSLIEISLHTERT